MGSRVGVTRVDRIGEAGGRAQAVVQARIRAEALERVGAESLRMVDAHAVLAVVLGPVESAIGQARQLVARGSLGGEGGDTAANRQLGQVVHFYRSNARTDGAGDVDGLLARAVGPDHGELVSAQPEGLTAVA